MSCRTKRIELKQIFLHPLFYLVAFKIVILRAPDFTMKAVFVLLVCLPFLFANTVDESALKAYKRMTPQERLSGRLCLLCILWFVSSWIFYVLKLIFFKSRSILLTLEARTPLYYCLFVLFTKQTTKCNSNKFLIYMFTNNES